MPAADSPPDSKERHPRRLPPSHCRQNKLDQYRHHSRRRYLPGEKVLGRYVVHPGPGCRSNNQWQWIRNILITDEDCDADVIVTVVNTTKDNLRSTTRSSSRHGIIKNIPGPLAFALWLQVSNFSAFSSRWYVFDSFTWLRSFEPCLVAVWPPSHTLVQPVRKENQLKSSFWKLPHLSPWHISIWRRGAWWGWGWGRRRWGWSWLHSPPPHPPLWHSPLQSPRSCCTWTTASPWTCCSCLWNWELRSVRNNDPSVYSPSAAENRSLKFIIFCIHK